MEKSSGRQGKGNRTSRTKRWIASSQGCGVVYRRRVKKREFNSASYPRVALLEAGNRSLNTKHGKRPSSHD